MARALNPHSTAVTSATQAFNAGFRAKLRGAQSQPNYKNALMVAAYERGYRRAEELGKKKEK